MFEVKPMSLNKDTGTGAGERGPSPAQFESFGTGCESLYLCDSQDWLLSSGCLPEEGGAISPLLAEETLRYMTFLALEPSTFSHTGSHSLSQVLSGERVEQMTKTYNDIDMVTHLLAERDRDLELAARIGQSLLQRNHVLQERNEAVEEQLAQALDQVQQLQHELSKKDELLRVVASASEESESDSSCSTPLRRGHIPGLSSSLCQLEALQSKLKELEEENLELRSEAHLLKTETITYEEKEQRLVSDCVKELRESNSQMVTLTHELTQKNEQVLRHQDEISQLLSQIVELQHRVKELALEKEELRIHLQASKDAQRQLTAELKEVQDRNTECVGMLQESQEEVRELRSRTTQAEGMRRHLPYTLFPMDSLAAEIEGTLSRERSAEDEGIPEDQRSSQRRVFQTVRCVNESTRSPREPHPIPGSAHSCVVMTAQPFRSSLGEGGSREGAPASQPGSPAESDLTSTLHRLSLRRQTFLSERRFFQAERSRNPRAADGGVSGDDREASRCSSPGGRVFSSAPNLLEMSSTSGCYKSFLPEKLQIVKPMEGSLTLHHWQQLARPHLATILDPHPGVVTKGFRPLPQDTVYRLGDPEEDEEVPRGEDMWESRHGGEEERKDEDEEEEGGITFRVQRASTPVEKRHHEETPTILSAQSVLPPHVMPACPTPPSHPDTCTPSTPLHSTVKLLSAPAPSSAHNPGKCLSSTSSTYTFTTCRILHPCDITQVTSSSARGPTASALENLPSSLRTGPSTPVTPCRLNLGDSFPSHHPSGPHGLAKLLLEKGISAQVSARTSLLKPEAPSSSCPSPPTTPPQFEAAASDTFLASRPAELFLQDVYRLKPGRVGMGLLERLRRLGLATVLPGDAVGSDALHQQDSATILATRGGSLLDGIRRNQSLPAMIGGRAPRVSSPVQPMPVSPSNLTLPITPWGSRKLLDPLCSSQDPLPLPGPKS